MRPANAGRGRPDGLRGYAAGAQHLAPLEKKPIDPCKPIAQLLEKLRAPGAAQPSTETAVVALNLCSELQQHLEALLHPTATGAEASAEDLTSTSAIPPQADETPARGRVATPPSRTTNKSLHHVPSSVSFQMEPIGLRDELEQTSEIRRSDSRLAGLSHSSSMTSFAGGELPILLPGKLQWVRDKHMQLDTMSKLKTSQSLRTLGIESLPSEMFFGKYDQEGIDTSSRRGIMASNEYLGPLAEDAFYSRATQKQRIRKEARDRSGWSLQSFDRIGSHYAAV